MLGATVGTKLKRVGFIDGTGAGCALASCSVAATTTTATARIMLSEKLFAMM